MSSITYKFRATCLNHKGQEITSVTKPTLTETIEAPISGLWKNATKDVQLSLVREKPLSNGAVSVDSVVLDVNERAFVGRFSKHNTNVPVTLQREAATVLEALRG